MFKNTYPNFENKKLLKVEMLESLRDFPREIFELLYRDAANGIITGVQVQAGDQELLISPGILCWNNMLYSCGETVKIPYQTLDKLVYLKVRFAKGFTGAGRQDYLTQIYIDSQAPDQCLEIELARFRLQEGAGLRDQYTGFFDYETEFDTINRIHVPYSAVGRSTIWPELLKEFAKTLMKHPVRNPWDHSFCLNCLQLSQGMPYEAISQYLEVRLQERRASYTNEEIFKALGRILHDADGREPIKTNENNEPRKMMLW